MGHPLPVAAATRHRRQDAIVTPHPLLDVAVIHRLTDRLRLDAAVTRHLTILRHPDAVATRRQTTRRHPVAAATPHRRPDVGAAL